MAPAQPELKKVRMSDFKDKELVDVGLLADNRKLQKIFPLEPSTARLALLLVLDALLDRC